MNTQKTVTMVSQLRDHLEENEHTSRNCETQSVSQLRDNLCKIPAGRFRYASCASQLREPFRKNGRKLKRAVWVA